MEVGSRTMNTVANLASTWREDAEKLRIYGDERGAVLVETLAGQLENALREADTEVLTLDEAAQASGYSKRRLRELVAEGKVPNAGEKGRPRLLRGDLPTKPGRRGSTDDYDASEDARAILGRIGRS